MPERNPCLSCGACCALFVVAFDQTETDETEGGIVPSQYTARLDQTRCAMRGTERGRKRCIALEGIVGRQVRCTIYERRPLCCHNFLASWQHNVTNPVCDRARCVYGLQPFDAF